MEESPARRIGLPWYKAEDYPSILALMADRHVFASTYTQWLMAAQNNEMVAQQAGIEIVRVLIEPEPFSRWCAARALTPSSAARMEYVAEHRRTTGEEA